MSIVQRTPPPKRMTQSNLLSTPLNSMASDPELHLSSHHKEKELISRRVKRKRCDDFTIDSSPVLCQIKDMFKAFELQQNTKLEKLSESMLTIENQNTEIQKSLDFLSSKYDEVIEKMHKLEQSNKSYELRIESLQSKIEQLERNARGAMVEIKNIPKQDLENKQVLSSIVKKVGEVIQQQISTLDIQDVYRIKTKN